MTEEAQKLLTWIAKRPRSLWQVVYHGSPEYRRLRRLCLAELIDRGYIKRVHGWYIPSDAPANEPSIKGP